MKLRYCVVLLLAGCNSTDGSTNSFSSGSTTTTTGSSNTNSGPVYETLDSTSSNTSTLAGTAVTTNGATLIATFHNVTGSMRHNNGRFALTDSYALVDNDGFDNQNKATDGNATLELLTSGRNYKYMIPYATSYTAGGTTNRTIGIFGIPTRGADLPSTGSAVYTGEAVMAYNNKNGTAFTHSSTGRTTISANFGNKTVDVNSRFSLVRDGSGNLVPNPVFDEINENDMIISGGTFSGGTYNLRRNGTMVDPIGANATALGRGHFFGGEAAGSGTRPAEAGGITVFTGDSGSVIHTYFGD